MSMYMNKSMAERLDPVLPAAGGLMRLQEVRMDFARKLKNPEERCSRTFLHPQEAAHLNKAFELLGDDEEAKASLMSYIAFAQMKNDCAGF